LDNTLRMSRSVTAAHNERGGPRDHLLSNPFTTALALVKSI
jgi:hypothetical protein